MPDTELDRARALLLAQQNALARVRIAKRLMPYLSTGPYEENVLAALSRVWDAQERALAAFLAETGTTGITRDYEVPRIIIGDSGVVIFGTVRLSGRIHAQAER